MKSKTFASTASAIALPLLALLMASSGWAQQTSEIAQKTTPVPHLVSYSGILKDGSGRPAIGITGVTFLLYRDAEGGAPVWMETQSVQPDSAGRYTAQLGATRSEGLPPEMFMTGEARWLAVQAAGAPEQPRVLLVAVPYAMKAADAETIGGLPPSAFMLAVPPKGGAAGSSVDAGSSNSAAGAPPPASTVTTTGGTLNALPLWTTATNVQSSAITQTGSGATAKIGIGTTAPAAVLDVKGSEYLRGLLTLPATGTATAAAGKNSQPQDFIASSFSGATSTAVNQKFQWQAEPAANNTANPSSTLNLLFGLGASTPTETGLKVSNKGILTFVAGQTFPGTVKSVGFHAPSSDFSTSGSPVTGSGTLGLSWKIAPTSLSTPSAIVKRDANGSFSAGPISVLATADNSIGLTATDNGANSYGVLGSGTLVGVRAYSSNYGLYGEGITGVYGEGSFNGVTAKGASSGVSGQGGDYGLFGTGTTGVYGSGDSYGVYGTSSLWAVWGESAGADGVHGVSHTGGGSGVGAVNDAGGDGIFAAVSDGGYAGFFYGDVDVDGNLTKAAGSFKIDHPLDPANKYLYHSFVESPDMMNIYNGNVTLDGNGEAFVPLPEWFQKLNRDFRYQLTCLDGFAPIYIAQRVQGNRFKIAGGKPGMEVSWQVTGVRQDAWANAHRIPVEQVKPEKERGSYLHPELFGAPAEKSIAWARHPETMKRVKERLQLPAPLRSSLAKPGAGSHRSPAASITLVKP
jgi:hypothetical protein